jgi:hypothetical protein
MIHKTVAVTKCESSVQIGKDCDSEAGTYATLSPLESRLVACGYTSLSLQLNV